MPTTSKSKGKGVNVKRSKSRKLNKGSDDDAQKRLEMKFKHAAKLRAEALANTKVEPPKPPGKYDDKSDFLKWIYSIPLSRRLRFLPNDFSDGGCSLLL